ncbi:hypothetical protein TPHA_0G01670 [Tetrapisispora phaffii CBS 4417]|uniref:Oxysterol-binding protein n=1 Tax=Tetrapisispora phaffii (strain ATCC 24235 / CBS 4417 / NBRC 1672 / NRRL Y-8282 / UCD 70-5) TaxID=1071381 RepID=G8BVS5_TETPH|nr:hypothetical protein TPHA_0G01670 [Tetrapisispora phaffii CBS 4417]CCE64003.1 hypothetical protein TPHA_0G01670 [Tetrapisispora phaffii CBS 4417]
MSASSISKSGTWTSFLKSLASFNGDLSKLSAPPFILSPVSLSEYPRYWADHQEVFVEPSLIDNENYKQRCSCDKNVESPEMARMLAVIKWFICTMRSQYASRTEKQGNEKKPLNPFLGELFVGKWSNKDDPSLGETILLTEQVSHHPPITGYSILNDKHNIRFHGYNHLKTSISKTLTLNVKQYGHAMLHIRDDDETYLITLPPLHIEGILAASPYAELEGRTFIQSSTGLLCSIDYSGKGYFSGKKNTFKARIFKDPKQVDDKTKATYTINGQWSKQSTIVKHDPKLGDSEPKLFFDAELPKVCELYVKPIEEQHPLESRKAWKDVADAIIAGDMSLISKHKTALEEKQRAMRKEEESEGRVWQTRWFNCVNYDLEESASSSEDGSSMIGPTEEDQYLALAKAFNLSTKNVPSGTLAHEKHHKKADLTSLHWRFVRENWDNDKDIIA